jgi:hypothetical protein
VPTFVTIALRLARAGARRIGRTVATALRAGSARDEDDDRGRRRRRRRPALRILVALFTLFVVGPFAVALVVIIGASNDAGMGARASATRAPVEGGRTVRTAQGDEITLVPLQDRRRRPLLDERGRPVEVAEDIAPQVQALLLSLEVELEGAVTVLASYRTAGEQVQATVCTTAATCEPIALPGASPHEQGRALDLACEGRPMGRRSACYRWLGDNADRFGLRSCDRTRPWHWTDTCD